MQQRLPAAAQQAPASSPGGGLPHGVSSSGSQPVSIPGTSRVLPYSRLSLRAHSASSASPSTQVLAAAAAAAAALDCSPSQVDEILPAAVAAAGSAGAAAGGAAAAAATAGGAQQGGQAPNKRPPLPPSPQARGSAHTPLTPAWIHPGSSSSGSGGRHARVLAAAAAASSASLAGGSGSYSGAPGLLSSSLPTARGYLQQQQQQVLADVSWSGPASCSPASEGVLAASPSCGDLSAAAGNPYHPQHDAAMQLLLQHQEQQLQALQHQQQHRQQRQQRELGGSYEGRSSSYLVMSQQQQQQQQQAFGQGGPGNLTLGAGRSPGSPTVLSRNSSYGRLSELGTSPGLIEASFMGMAARHSSSSSSQRGGPIGTANGSMSGGLGRTNSSSSVGGAGTTSRSATLQAMLASQQAAVRQQQEQQQQRYGAPSLAEWAGRGGGGSRAGSEASSSRPQSSNLGGGWDLQQQQQAQQFVGGPASLLRGGGRAAALVGSAPGQHAGGMRALPGRPGLHWLPRADDRESAARGLLGLPRPGLVPGRRMPPQLLQQQQEWQQHQQQHQQHQHQQLDAAEPQACRALGHSLSMGELRQWTGGSSSNSQQPPGWPAGDHTAAAAAAAAAAQADAGAAGSGTSPRSPAAAPVGSPLWGLRNIRAAAAVAAGSTSNSPLAAAGGGGGSSGRGLFASRSFGRQLSSASGRDRSGSASLDLLRSGSQLSGRSLMRSASSIGMPTCLICLDQLTSEDFEAGEAMQLECRCKGDVALRHRSCAEKWSRIKGNTLCDVCKAPILNLPDVPPLPPPPEQGGLGDGAGGGVGNGLLVLDGHGLWGPLGDEPPAAADYMFDCIRVTWVVLIVCILFFELSVNLAFVIGAIAGCGYVAVAASWSAWQRCRQQRRAAATAAAAIASWGHGGEHHVPLLLADAGADGTGGQWV